jgi:hypothetical protein
VLPDLVPTEYSLRMYITYTRDVAAISPLDISVFRAPNCQYHLRVTIIMIRTRDCLRFTYIL